MIEQLVLLPWLSVLHGFLARRGLKSTGDGRCHWGFRSAPAASDPMQTIEVSVCDAAFMLQYAATLRAMMSLYSPAAPEGAPSTVRTVRNYRHRITLSHIMGIGFVCVQWLAAVWCTLKTHGAPVLFAVVAAAAVDAAGAVRGCMQTR